MNRGNSDPIDPTRFAFEPGSHEDVWLAKWDGRPIGAVGYAVADGRWRAAWRGALIGGDYDTREDAARALLQRLRDAPE